MKSLIITGATSMVGAATVSAALAEGRQVAAVVRKNSPHIGNLKKLDGNKRLEVIECDISNYEALDFSVQYDAFLHMAWKGTSLSERDDPQIQINNIRYTFAALQAAKRAGCEVFIDAGSQAEYGRVDEVLNRSTPCNPESGYGIAKYAAGKLACLTASQIGLRACHTRILSAYGEGMASSTLIIYLIKTLLSGGKPSLTECEQIWDYMYVRDTAAAFLAIADRGIHGKTYPLGSGIAKPLREYVEVIRDLIDPALPLGFGEKEYYPHQPMFLQANIDDLKLDTGFTPIWSFIEGIKNTIGWVKG